VTEPRDYNAEYYDAFTTTTEDIEFYAGFANPQSRVLELGCGTGRVAGALASSVASVVGVDISPSMLERARARSVTGDVEFVQGDITSVRLEGRFDLIIAPFRVMQCLEHRTQVDGLFEVIRAHLATDGLAILNVFHPLHAREDMASAWPSEEELSHGEVVLPNGDRLVRGDVRPSLDAERQVLYPELIYRRYRGDELVDEHINPICMRYYYPDEFKELVVSQGFTVMEAHGGYAGEAYGQGSELLLAFRA